LQSLGSTDGVRFQEECAACQFLLNRSSVHKTSFAWTPQSFPRFRLGVCHPKRYPTRLLIWCFPDWLNLLSPNPNPNPDPCRLTLSSCLQPHFFSKHSFVIRPRIRRYPKVTEFTPSAPTGDSGDPGLERITRSAQWMPLKLFPGLGYLHGETTPTLLKIGLNRTARERARGRSILSASAAVST